MTGLATSDDDEAQLPLLFGRVLDGKGGVYLTNNEVGRQLTEDDDDKIDNDSVKPGVKDPVNAGRLWRLCEELTGARLD